MRRIPEAEYFPSEARCKREKCGKPIDKRDLSVQRPDGKKYDWCRSCGAVSYLEEGEEKTS